MVRAIRYSRAFFLLLGLIGLAGCGNYTQVTSGKEYLSKYSGPPGGAQSGKIDPDIRAAADVEPLLRFPARIGLARLDNARLSGIPEEEAGAWMELAKQLGPDWGEFVPVSPLIAAVARQAVGDDGTGTCHRDSLGCLDQTVRDIRLVAARQHIDAVLIYRAFDRTETTSNPLAVTKLALIGFFLPSEDVSAAGYAEAVLIDVRNGYTYGLASAKTDKPAYTLAASVNRNEVASRMGRQAETAAVGKLAGEVETMLKDLRYKLAEQRLKAVAD